MIVLIAILLIAAIRGAAMMTALGVLHAGAPAVPALGFIDSAILATCLALVTVNAQKRLTK